MPSQEPRHEVHLQAARVPRLTGLGDQPFTTAQAAARGVDQEALSAAVHAGQLRRLHHGVYLRSNVVPTVATRVRAASLATGARLVASHETAAELWTVDVEPPGADSDDTPGPPAVRAYLAPGVRPPRRPGLLVTTAVLRDEEVHDRGVPLTSPTRTAVDLARERDLVEAVVVLDAFLARGLTDRARLLATLGALMRQRGVVTARAAVEHADGRAESPMESRLRMLLVLAGLPVPEPQHVVLGADREPLARVDLAYVDARLALQYDGREHHLEPGRFLHDRHRHADLREVGWEVLRFTSDDVLRDRAATADRVRRFLDLLHCGPVRGR